MAIKQPRALRGQSLYGVDGGVGLERVRRELQNTLLWELFSVTLDGKSFCSELSMLLGWLLRSCCYPEQDYDLACAQNGPALSSALGECLRRTLSFSSTF